MKTLWPPVAAAIVLTAGCAHSLRHAAAAPTPAPPLETLNGRVWFDGTRDAETRAPGKLLSDNPGYWGDQVRTGVTYSYPSPPTNPPDAPVSDPNPLHRRLLDGRPAGDWSIPVGMNYVPLVVIFDFKQSCTFTEVDLATRSLQVAAQVEVSSQPDGPWQIAEQQNDAQSPPQALQRLALPRPTTGRYLRLSMKAAHGVSYLDEVWVWGDARNAAAPSTTGVPPELPVAAATHHLQHLSATPTLDGTLRETADLQELVLTPLAQNSGGPVTRAWVGLCPAGLYVAYDCAESDMANRYASNTLNAPAWQDDDVELFLSPPGHEHIVDQFCFSFRGSEFTGSKGRELVPMADSNGPRIRSAVHDYQSRWVAEAVVPLASIAGAASVDQPWRALLARSRKQNAKNIGSSYNNSSWPPIASQVFEVPWQFAVLDPTAVEGNSGSRARLLQSLPGDTRTNFNPDEFDAWKRGIGIAGMRPVALALPNFSLPGDRPFLPNDVTPNQPVQLLLPRNGTDAAAIAVVNPSTSQTAEVQIELGPLYRVGAAGLTTGSITGDVAVAGTVWTRRFGVVPRPLFFHNNILCRALMEKYLTNAAEIEDFPALRLPPGSTALLWISVQANGAAAGDYAAELRFGGERPLPVRATVLDATLPNPDHFLHTWSWLPTMLPFQFGASQSRAIDYRVQQGITVLPGWPIPGDALDIAHDRGRGISLVEGLPAKVFGAAYLGKLKPDDIDAAMQQQVRDYLLSQVAQAAACHLSYTHWAIELWDEPNLSNAAVFGKLAHFIKSVDPQVQIYCNPCFWEGSGFASDSEIYAQIGAWYNECVDISVPIQGLLDTGHFPIVNKKLFSHPRPVNAFYIHPCPGRKISWDAFEKGCNGWGYYAFYVPRGDPWDDFDGAEFDYETVYPGPNGVIPTTESESMRASWEDYRLLTLLKQQGRSTQLAALLQAADAGTLLQELRNQALRLAAQTK